MEGPIRSAANPLVKRLRAAAAGREEGVVLLEGERLVDDAQTWGWHLEVVCVADDRPEAEAALRGRGLRPVVLEASLLARASTLKTSPGVLALAARPEPRPLDRLPLPAGVGGAGGEGLQPLVVVVDGLADPGNLGALARSAEAAGAAALVVVSGASPWGPKALRGSMGSLLRLPVFEGHGRDEVASALAAAGYRVVAPCTRGGADWRRVDWAPATALWLGGETGDAEGAQLAGALRVTIPMAGGVESLNVAVSAALLLFAAGRVGAAEDRA